MGDESTRARVNDAKRSNGHEGNGLHGLARAGARRCERSDQPLNYSTHDRRSGQAGILIGQMLACNCDVYALCQFICDCPAKFDTQDVNVSVDRLGKELTSPARLDTGSRA